MCQQFISHNLATGKYTDTIRFERILFNAFFSFLGNFGSLITVFLSKVSELLELSDKDRLETFFSFFTADIQ